MVGVVSFLSTVPSLAISTRPHSAAPRYHPFNGRIRCCGKLEANVDRLPRRDFLNYLAFPATFCAYEHSPLLVSRIGENVRESALMPPQELIASCGTFCGDAYAADLIQRRQRSEFLSNIKGTLYTAIKANPDIIPSVLTLALNDAITYNKATKTGGANGSIWLSSEMSRPENKGLSAAFNLIEEAKKEIDSYSKDGPITYADLIQFAAQAATKATFLASAIRKCGGNEEKGNLLYTAYGSNGQWGLFDKEFGRTDAQEPDPEGRVPIWDEASVQDMKEKFKAVGFGPRQLAVMSAFLGPDQLETEKKLATDTEVAPWVQKYQRSRETVSQTDYEVDLITTLTKLSCMGQQINYEAYTYPVQKIELSKLKL